MENQGKKSILLKEDPEAEWYNFILDGEKSTIQADKLMLQKRGKTFTLKSDFLQLIAEFNFDYTKSTNAKVFFYF